MATRLRSHEQREAILERIAAHRVRKLVDAAFGAETTRVRRMVVRQGMALVAIGLALGLAACGSTRLPHRCWP